MDRFVTVASFTLPSEVAIAQAKLDSLGVESHLVDDLTIQSYNFLSNALGGVKLQVRESDVELALSILVEGGFIKNEKIKTTFVENKLADPVFLKKIRNFGALFICFILLSIIALGVAAALDKPSDYDKLAGWSWRLEHVVHGDEVYYPNTISQSNSDQFRIITHYNENIAFKQNGILVIPGFDSEPFTGSWYAEKGGIRISDVDAVLFNGLYDFEISRQHLTLSSQTTKLFCKRLRY